MSDLGGTDLDALLDAPPIARSEAPVAAAQVDGKTVQLWQGPQHPGVTGNMSLQLWVTGDTVQQGITHVGYLHRGFEKLMERRTYFQCFPLVCRICVPEPDTNEYLLAAALEELSGLEADVPERARWLRTLVLEMARLAALLASLGGQAGSMGLGTLPNWTYTLRDLLLDRFEELTGGRVYHMYIVMGGVRRDLPAGFDARLLGTLAQIEQKLPAIDKLLFESAVFRKRTLGVGVVPAEWADEMAITGPTLRAMGIARDVRKDFPYLAYPELDFEVVTAEGSDVYARTLVRRGEIAQGLGLLRQILERMPRSGPISAKRPNMLAWKIPAGQTYVRAESSRGEMGYYVVTDGGKTPRRVHVRGPSYVHGVTLLERLLPGANIADIAPLMVSLQVCPPEIER